MRDPELDFDIIFKHDEDIHDGARIQYSFHVAKDAQAGQDKRGNNKTGNNLSDHGKMTAADWDHAFTRLLESHLINVPNGYYEDSLFFTDPNRLTGMFTDMETENLQMI